MSNYFKNFPSVSYNGALATNLTKRAKIDSVVRDKTSIFYTYTLRDGDRPDTIAESYYDDADFAWVVYYSNQILDPYFEWPLNQQQLEQLLITKYGSVAYAEELVLFFRVNWEHDETMKNVAGFNALPSATKKYWKPIFDYKNTITSYERADVDWVVENSRTIHLTHDGTGTFAVGEMVKQGTAASGFVQTFSETDIIVDKVQGEFTAGSLTNFHQTQTTSVDTATVLYYGISLEELVYWEPITAFQYEDELNEQKKNIYLIDKRYINQIELEMKTVFA